MIRFVIPKRGTSARWLADYDVNRRATIPWFAHRDDRGEWVVERRGAWSCVVTLTGPSWLSDERMEAHARAVADALNRVYAQ